MIVRSKNKILSQAKLFTKVSEYIPLEVYVCPFQVYKLDAVIITLEVVELLIVTDKVCILSQPAVLV